MRYRSRSAAAFAATLALLAAACTQRAPLLADPAALAQAQRALATRPEFAGHAPLVHAAALFHDDDIEVAMVDPADAGRLHVYRYAQGQWRREDSMSHSCAAMARLPGGRSDDLPLDRLAFATAARVRASWYERARALPGGLADPDDGGLKSVWFRTGGDRGPGRWTAAPIAGKDGAHYRIEFAADGSARRVERLR